MKFKEYIFVFILLIGFGFSIPITNCQIINAPGTYEITADINFDEDDLFGNNCILINSSNVILNCNNNKLEFEGHEYGRNAIKINENNIEIKNCVIINSNIQSINSNYSNIHDNFLKGAINIENSYFNIINNNTINETYYGINILNSDDNNITNNKINNCSEYAVQIRASHENLFLNNNLKIGNRGFYLIGSNDNHIKFNSIYGFNYGFKEEGSDSASSFWNWIKNNDFCLNDISMQCEHTQIDENNNFCDSSSGCGIECYECIGCYDPDAIYGSGDVRRATSVSVYTPVGTDFYPDECITGILNSVNESTCDGDNQEYSIKTCPMDYVCSDGECIEDSGTSPVCIDWDNLDGTISLENQKRIGSFCTDLTTGLDVYDTCNAITEELNEKICTSDGCRSISLECETCIDGSSGDHCIDEAITANCTDTDFDMSSGTTIVLDIFGTATDTDGRTYSDRCLSEDTIQEAWCNPNLIGGVADTRNFECPSSTECDPTTNTCVPVCNDDDELNNMSYPGTCSCGSENSFDECYGEEHCIFGYCWQENIKQANCEDSVCEYTNYPNCNCPSGTEAKCFAGVCGCSDDELLDSLRTYTFCNDPDGNNYYNAGHITFGTEESSRSLADVCINDRELKEFTCEEITILFRTYHYPWNEVIECPYGCEEGRCIPNTECEDHDESFSNPYIEPSFAEYDSEIYADICLDSNTVIEQYCEGGVIQNETHYCSYGCLENLIGLGYCALSSSECMDSDPIQNISICGNCYDYTGLNSPDKCSLGQLKQSYCNETRCIYEEPIDCPEGQRCVLGECKEITCIDSDEGINYGEEGICEGFSTWGEDECLGDIIIEYYCNTTNECESIEHECESGICINASCIECYDSDGGDNSFVYGECISEGASLNDTCSGTAGVLEAVCDHGTCTYMPKACIRTCEDGRCDPGVVIKPTLPKFPSTTPQNTAVIIQTD
ncbi:MAG: NosD domain-containing protein [Candidatus Micrarchaeia archaeon]|jgi:parallel beta-helix repeat protein